MTKANKAETIDMNSYYYNMMKLCGVFIKIMATYYLYLKVIINKKRHNLEHAFFKF